MSKPTEKEEKMSPEPLMAKYEETVAFRNEGGAEKTTRTRRNAASNNERTNRFTHIEKGLIPFNYSEGATSASESNIDVRESVVLCQKCYYNFAIFRNTIDLMTEFSTSDLYFTGGSQKSRSFFDSLFKRIDIASLQEKFFREYYRSGNVFIYRFDAVIQKDDLATLSKVFGVKKLTVKNEVTLPSRFIILNPADIQAGGNVSFVQGRYYKRLSDYELQRLRAPRTEEDAQVLNSLSPSIRENIKKKTTTSVTIPIDPAKTCAVFYKKQDYEPLAVPMGWPVLEAINAKQEMRLMDMAIARTTHQAILLITMGTEPDKGGVNQKNLEAMQKLFSNESVGRVLISDYTTKAEFIIPDIAEILDPKKYEVIDRDINVGLNNILVGGEKYANQQTKVEVFMARLKQGRAVFIREFLEPEIKRIAKELGFRNYPKPHLEDIPLKEDYNLRRIYGRLVEVGVLTPEEGIMAIRDNRLPDADESLESQKRFKGFKEDGLYEPITGGPYTQKQLAESKATIPGGVPPEAGRPPGISTPQPTNRQPAKIGERKVKANFSLKKIKANFTLAGDLSLKVEQLLIKKHGLKELSQEQGEIAAQITEIIIANESPEDWTKLAKIKKYVESPVDANSPRVREIHSIALEHQVDTYVASILYASKA